MLITSCTVHKPRYEYIQVYKRDGIGLILPDYLILKPMRGTFNLYAPGTYTDISGPMYIKGDTICLIPKQEYIKDKFYPIDSADISISSIPLYFIRQKDRLKNITNYKKYPELRPFVNELMPNDFKQKRLIDY